MVDEGAMTSGASTGSGDTPTTGDPPDPPVGPPIECERPVEWSVRFGGPTSDTLRGLAVDPTGNIYIGLDLRNLGESAPVKFGAFEIVPGELSNIVLAKLTTEGEVMWVRQFGGPGDAFMWTMGRWDDAATVS